MKGIDLDKSQTLECSQWVKELCDPILSPVGISYFNYIKIYHQDCSRELLTNRPDWISHFYKHALYNSAGAIDVEHLLPKGYFLWSELDVKDPIYLQGRDFFDIDHGISFVIKRDDVTYLYIFAANQSQHEVNNFYIRNIDLLHHFIHYFNDSGQALIQHAEKNRIYLPKPQTILPRDVGPVRLNNEAKIQFFEATKINRYFLLNESDDLYLTSKQADCAALLIMGYSSKEIAKKMELSYRTVEGYVLEIKKKIQEKIGYISRDKLIEILSQSNLPKIK
ncbi:helix-turn-helix transcriptional regulator [Legionella yabuuchiae]|uniref:helix-turn-helix transcriptional regulator n=1 Tax=Legionella yabuuchiae TaxID=376727 RepID=UPI0010547356|nr:helix-turn-helix transcriptional regulator [Legionella yabuuchiae]